MTSDAVIEVRDFRLTYPDGSEALKRVTFSVQDGESMAILGPNGAGKSTLLLSLVGVLRGTGEISVGGTLLSDSSLSQIRRTAQLVFQDPNDQLFMPLIGDDVAFGPLNFGVPKAEVPQLVEQSLQRVGLPGFADRNAFNTSAGERKRAALATVLACSPGILLLDEPTAGLDPRGRRELVELLNGIHATKLIATHDLEFARSTCRRALVLIEGAIAASGPVEELLADADLLRDTGLN